MERANCSASHISDVIFIFSRSKEIQMFKSISTAAVFVVLCICVQAYAGEGCQMTGMPSLCKEFINQQFGGEEIVWDKYGGSGGYSAMECFGQVCGNKSTMAELATVWKNSGLSNKDDIVNHLISSFFPSLYCPRQSPIPALFNTFYVLNMPFL